MQTKPSVEDEKFVISISENKDVQFVNYDQSDSDRPELTSAKIVISGGRNAKWYNFKLSKELPINLGRQW